MRKQQQIWQKEHENRQTLPTMANVEPASGVVLFVEWLKNHEVALNGRAVDIGSGKGRNAIYLAKQGFSVDALEYIAFARECTIELAQQNHVTENIHVHDVAVDEVWPFEDNYFDIAIDSFSSIDIETKQGREIYRDEMLRTLKAGGYAFVNVCSADDEWEAELIANHPGPEPNSTIWPENGKFQKDYSEDELREFYAMYEICELKTIKKLAYKLGRNGTATNFWLVLRKK